jgi:hypothetical protein
MRDDEAFERRLAAALKTRPVIDQAKGILIGVHCETPEAAFAELKYVSEESCVKVAELAAALVDMAAGRDIEDQRLAEVVRKEWGDRLPGCSAGASGAA